MNKTQAQTYEEKAISEWLKEGFSKKGKVKLHLAEICGVSRQAVGDWVKSGQVHKRHLLKISEYLDSPIPNSAFGFSHIMPIREPSPEFDTEDNGIFIDSITHKLKSNKDKKPQAKTIFNKVCEVKNEYPSIDKINNIRGVVDNLDPVKDKEIIEALHTVCQLIRKNVDLDKT
ncbi:hypothetical protein ACOI22_03515 [Glaciecola sp. 2405UD65-10]|uniref:hypothetical protein n=1 Tax=Glaciecola sp. 2405UD65-10 TaxID=3397244 RepID=UPI003B593364